MMSRVDTEGSYHNVPPLEVDPRKHCRLDSEEEGSKPGEELHGPTQRHEKESVTNSKES